MTEPDDLPRILRDLHESYTAAVNRAIDTGCPDRAQALAESYVEEGLRLICAAAADRADTAAATGPGPAGGEAPPDREGTPGG